MVSTCELHPSPQTRTVQAVVELGGGTREQHELFAAVGRIAGLVEDGGAGGRHLVAPDHDGAGKLRLPPPRPWPQTAGKTRPRTMPLVLSRIAARPARTPRRSLRHPPHGCRRLGHGRATRSASASGSSWLGHSRGTAGRRPEPERRQARQRVDRSRARTARPAKVWSRRRARRAGARRPARARLSPCATMQVARVDGRRRRAAAACRASRCRPYQLNRWPRSRSCARACQARRARLSIVR